MARLLSSRNDILPEHAHVILESAKSYKKSRSDRVSLRRRVNDHFNDEEEQVLRYLQDVRIYSNENMISYLLYNIKRYGDTIDDNVIRAEYFARLEQLIDTVKYKYEDMSPKPAPEPIDDWW